LTDCIGHHGFLGQDAQRGEAVFYLLERRQHGLAIRGHGGIVGGQVLGNLRAAAAGVENGFGQRGADREEPAGPA
jgi:hypothetical protein